MAAIIKTYSKHMPFAVLIKVLIIKKNVFKC